MKLTLDRIAEIFESVTDCHLRGDNAVQGILIFAKYLDPATHTIITGAGHEEIYGPDADALIDKGLTEEDALALAKLNWSYDNLDDESFTCFV